MKETLPEHIPQFGIRDLSIALCLTLSSLARTTTSACCPPILTPGLSYYLVFVLFLRCAWGQGLHVNKCPQRPKKGIRYPGAGIIGGWKQPNGSSVGENALVH